MKTSKTSKSASKPSTQASDDFAVAFAMYRFWVKMCQLNGFEKNLPWLEKAHKEIIRLCKSAAK